MTIDGQQGNWLKFSPQSIIYPEFVISLPENFTLEFNLATIKNFSYYSTYFNLIVAQLGNVLNEYPKWKQYGQKSNRLETGLHPQSAGGKGTHA